MAGEVRGYFEIGIYNVKSEVNVGTLWRSAYQFGASGIFTIGKRYKQQASDTVKAQRHIPLRQFEDWDKFWVSLPIDAPVIAIEMGGRLLSNFCHPERAIYLLGAEDHGLPGKIIQQCHHHISLESVRIESYNVAVAGSIVMYHRAMSRGGFNG